MKNIFLVLILFFFINSWATQNISEIQEENCYDYKQFEKFHRCAEKLTKDSYQYKFSFAKEGEDFTNLGFVNSPSSQPGKSNSPRLPSQTRQPIVKDRKIGRNEKVTIKRGDETKVIKWKKAQELVNSGEWVLVDNG